MGNLNVIVRTKSRPKRGAPKVRHAGRHKAKIEHYYANHYPYNKLRRILRSCGRNRVRAMQLAKTWAMPRGYAGAYVDLVGKSD